MEKYNMYAYAHFDEAKVIQIATLGDFHKKISEKTKVESGVITGVTSVWDAIKKPFPFYFIWKPDKFLHAGFTTAHRNGYEFSLDLRLQIRDGDNLKSHFNLSFAQCKVTKQHRVSGQVKVDASCNFFRMES